MKEEFKELMILGEILVISNMGRVFLNGEEKKYHYSKDGYTRISLHGSTPSVHILVAKAFIPNDDTLNKVEVNHKDFNRKNAKVDNLEWVTHQENVEYSKNHNRYSMVDKTGVDNPNYGNNKLSSFYKDNPDIALEKQSRKGKQNGRATPILMYKNNILIQKFDYIVLCLEYLQKELNTNYSIEGLRSSLNRAIKNNKPYKGYTFIKINKK